MIKFIFDIVLENLSVELCLFSMLQLTSVGQIKPFVRCPYVESTKTFIRITMHRGQERKVT